LTFVGDTSMAVLFGGYANGMDLADAWLLDYSDPESPVWERLEVDGPAPGRRAGHSAVWDPEQEQVIIYGGIRGLTYLDDAWALDPGLGPDPTATPTERIPPPTGTVDVTATVTASPSGPTPGGPGGPLYIPLAHRPE
jgi:hypothetical protein